MNDHPPSKWETLVASVQVETQPAEAPAPFGFAVKVVARWREHQREAALQRWSLWSLRAALCSAAACVLLILSRQENAPEILLQPPAAGFITPPLTTP